MSSSWLKKALHRNVTQIGLAERFASTRSLT